MKKNTFFFNLGNLSIVGLFLFTFLFAIILENEANARAGGGRSFGSSGGRHISSRPAYNSSSSSYSQRNQQGQQNQQQQQPQQYQRSASPFGGFLQTMAAGVAGGFLGSMLFKALGGEGGLLGSLGQGMLGGIMKILLIALLVGGAIFLIRKMMAKKDSSAPYYRPQHNHGLNTNIDTNINTNIDIDHEKFKEYSVDQFFNIQAAWMNRDLSPVRDLLADEIYAGLDQDIRRLRYEGRINRIENIAVRRTEIVETRKEFGTEYVTVHFEANLLDYTVDEKNNEILSGSKTRPIKFEEFWTYARDSRGGSSAPWKLSAIEQATE